MTASADTGQRTLMQAAYDQFKASGDWPQVDVLQHRFDVTGTDLDVDSVGKALDPLYGRMGRGSQATLELTLCGIARCRGSGQDLADVLALGRLAYQMYLKQGAGVKARLLALSHIQTWRGEHRQALSYLEEARASLDTLDARRRASFLASLAVSYRDAGDMEGAIRAGAESLAFFTAANEAAHVASLENNLALAHLRLGQLGRARKYAAEARGRATELGDQRLLAHVAESEAQIAVASDDLSGAAALLDEAQQFAVASDNHAALLSIALTRARLSRRQLGAEAALDSYAAAAELAHSGVAPSKRREILREFADAALEAGQQEQAIALYREGLLDPPPA